MSMGKYCCYSQTSEGSESTLLVAKLFCVSYRNSGKIRVTKFHKINFHVKNFRRNSYAK